MKRQSKKYLKRFFLLIGLILLAGFIWYYDLVLYGLAQARGQYKILNGARPVEEVLNDTAVAPSVKRKIRLVGEICRFAADSLGMEENDNYTTYYEQNGKPVLWVVTGCKPYQLKAWKWDYAFLGKMGYRGYFEKSKAIAEAKRLGKMGLDTNVSTVSAWSTLGWFKDPILSQTLQRSEGRLANLIIHELTHHTVFIKDSVSLNENLANLVGDKGARKFLSMKYGKNSARFKAYDQHMHDYRIYTGYVLKQAKKLDSMYRSWQKQELQETEKEIRKQKFIDHFLDCYDTLNFSKQTNYANLFKQIGRPDNTFFMQKLRYDKQNKQLDSLLTYRYQGRIDEFLTHFKTKYDNL